MPYFWSKSYLGFPVVGRVEEGCSITLADATGLCCNYAIPAQVKIPSPTLSPRTFEGIGLEDLGIWPRSFFWIHDCPMLMLGVRGNRVYPRSPSASVGKRKRSPSLKAKTWSFAESESVILGSSCRWTIPELIARNMRWFSAEFQYAEMGASISILSAEWLP